MTYDVIILGAGIIGVTLAHALTGKGKRVLLLDPNGIATGTTAASFAWANASTKTGDEAYHRLNVAGMQAHRALAAAYGAGPLGITLSGALQVVASDDEAGLKAMRRDAEILTAFGYSARILDTAGLQALEPDLTFTAGEQALHLPDDMIIDAPRFTQFLADRMQEQGGTFLRARADNILADDMGKVHGVDTDHGPKHAPQVIVTAGKDTGQVLADLTGYAPFAGRFPVKQVPGLLLTTPPVANIGLRHLIYGATSNELHVLPTGQGGLKIGSDDIDAQIWDDTSDSAKARGGAALLERATRFWPDLPDRVDLAGCQLQIGIRAYPEDGKTLIGPLPGADGLSVIATHSGITLAPALAGLMTDWITTGRQPAVLQPFSLDRMPGFA
ncbi:MAG TPA: FAD-binding oxidoreductase [Aliiroseovarius sp.]|nr:FAD-binding oxidoreductase [Aliiroseovarius sp.]